MSIHDSAGYIADYPVMKAADFKRLTGNIRPTETMVIGTPDTVRENVRENLRQAYDSPRGYIIRMGCGLPINASPENIQALVDAAWKYGRYPFDPGLLAA